MELKIRMWSNNANKYFYNRDSFECLVQHIRFNEGYPFLGVPFDHVKDGMVFEQYTGLKDKNGKEIFEGDIIKIENYSSQIQKMELIGVVSYGFAAWCVEIKKVNKWEKYSVPEPTTKTILYFLNLVNSKRYEIIGNVHLNPDLIA